MIRRARLPLPFLALVLLVLGAAPAFAGRGDKSGTAAASELLIPVGARSISLGGASLSGVSGIEAMFWNPAGLARSESGTDVLFSHMSYLAGIGVEYAGLSARLGDAGRIGLAVKSLSVGEIAVTTEDQPDGTGETASPTFLVAGITCSRQMSERIYAGITANVVYENMDRVSASGFAFSAGVQYFGLGGIEGLSLGAAVKNVGPQMKFDGPGLLRTAEVGDASRGSSLLKIESAPSDLPSTIEFGLGYSFALNAHDRVSVSSVFQNNNYSEDEYRFGGEYTYGGFLSLRAGVDISPQDEGNEYLFGPAAGVGIRTKLQDIGVSLDYAFRGVRYFGGNHAITLNVGF